MKEITARSYDPEYDSCIICIRRMEQGEKGGNYLEEMAERLREVIKPAD